MNKIFYWVSFALLVFVFTSCKNADVNPNSFLSYKEQEQFKYEVSRYVNHLAKYATNETKFDPKFDQEYLGKAQKSSLDKYYKGKGDTIYFEISKIAPSMQLKKIATAGKLVRNAQGNIVYYNEVYRTWKMEEPELKVKTKVLFNKMISGGDLSQYYTKNSGNDLYIEFPDEFTTFDINKRQWLHTEK